MATPELTPRTAFGGVVAVWIAAVVTALAVGVFVPPDWRAAWLILGLGGCVILGFVIQLAGGRSHGFTERVAASALGALLVMGVISAGFGLAAIVPG
ncbi:hypothetical protein [Microbacterium sp. P01]|uniref:hypothetical protein n=1 Tax=unclassified Microbacterium TaxID=2609290 RepID=UPI00366C27ED